jgi:TRAP-type C4-dicarboxylate transport system permease large subunit
MLVMATFFAQMIQLSPVSGLLQEWFGVLTSLSLLLTLTAIIVLILLLSLLGIHQMMTVTVLATSISSESIGLDPALFALTLAVGFALGSQSSPISTVNIVSSKLFHSTPLQLAKWNGSFILTMALFTPIFVYLVNRLLM